MYLPYYNNVIIGTIPSKINSLTIVYSIVFLGSREQIKENIKDARHREGNSRVAGEFPAQMASNAEIFSIRWRYHASMSCLQRCFNWTAE